MSWRDATLIDHHPIILTTLFCFRLSVRGLFFRMLPYAFLLPLDVRRRAQKGDKVASVVSPGEIMVVQRPSFSNGVHPLP